MNETMQRIHKISNERQQLWRKQGGLTAADSSRVQAITGELAVLWDQYRRELAGDNRLRNSDNARTSHAA